MAKTSSKEMDALHGQLATVLKDSIKELSASEEKKGLAALLNVARQFLKDNEVTALAVPNSPVQNLADSLPFVGDEFDGEEPYENSPRH